ncbi:hypothetical protein FHY29_003703 [Xanthomonas arboricola]|uniref:hypothetical protein n=1 Tax=Xanthomonas arboricola TaxID=56448 RepID=UPI0011B03375|nr:hypothetical protein [Xanthomonas arboricola]
MATNEKTGPKTAKTAKQGLEKWQHRQGFKKSGRVRFDSSTWQERQEEVSKHRIKSRAALEKAGAF